MTIDPYFFPYLKETEYCVTSEETPSYNCIAWAAEDNRRWWWPHAHTYWPPNVKREPTIDTFIKLFESLGYSLCNTDDLEIGYQKIALYALHNESTHAARQLENGDWTSKIGRNVDIRHSINGLNGPLYGCVVKIFKKIKN